MEVTLYSPHLLTSSTSNQSKGKWIFNFRFVTNVNVPPKGHECFYFREMWDWGSGHLQKHIQRNPIQEGDNFNIPSPTPPHHHHHHPVNGLPYI